VALVALAAVPLHGSRPREAPRLVAASGGTGPLRAGGASVPLDVPAGSPIGGYPRWDYASRGVRDAPLARALVLSVPGFTAAIVSVDVLLIPEALRARVEKRLSRLAPDALVVAATHTHAGPGGFWEDALGERFGTGPFDLRVLDGLAARIAEAVEAAAAARAPATLSVARSRRVDLVVNRDEGDPDGRLLVIRAERGPGDVVGQVVVFPAHATVLGSRNRQISGDWPAALARDLPGTTVVLQGAEGDQTWRLPPPPPTAPLPLPAVVPEDFAREVASEIRRLALPPGEPEATLAAAVAWVTLPDPSFGAVPGFLDRLVSNLLWNWLPSRVSVMALRIGPALLLAVPAEPGEAVGRRWRDLTGPEAEVVSLANDYVGYVDTEERVRARTGEARRTYLGPDLAQVLGDGLTVAVRAAEALPPAERVRDPRPLEP
jgi:neutral ceramidase